MHTPPAQLVNLARLLLLPLLLPLAACSTGNTRAEGERLMQITRDWSAAAQARDVEATLSYWSDDAVLIPPGEPVVEGKAAIREFVEGAFAIPGFSIRWAPTRASIARSGDLGYLVEETFSTVPDGAGGVITIPGRSVTIWRKDAAGNWKCIVDTWNDAPAGE